MKRLLQWIRERLPVSRATADSLEREVAKWVQINNESDRAIRSLKNDLDKANTASAEEIHRLVVERDKLVASVASLRRLAAESEQDWKTLITGRDQKIRNLETTVTRLSEVTRYPFEPRETDSPPPFDDDDRTRLREFLASPTGQRLARSLNWWSQYEEQLATLGPANVERACGKAAGFRLCAHFILHRISADTRLQQGDDTQSQQGAAGLRERVAP